MTSSPENTDQISFIVLAQSRDCLTEEFQSLTRDLTLEEKLELIEMWKGRI